MAKYEPFLVADFKTGLELDKEPWLLPKDAFKSMINAYIYQGTIRKRKGYREFAQIPGSPGNPIMGIFNFYATTGTSQLLAFDTKRMYRYNPATGAFVDPIGSDTWTGDDDQFFWTENWKDKLFITNNKDRVKKWDGSSLNDLLMDTDGDTNNDVDTCLLLFAYKERLIALRTTENGTLYAQRARWCKPGDPDDWSNDGYVDAPTVDWIMGADFIGDDLCVLFERSIWLLKYTGDSDLPFRWEKIADTEGCYSTFTVTNFADELIFLGPTRIMGTDAFDVYPLDDRIEDITLNFRQDGIQYCYAAVLEELRQNWITYPSITSTYSDEILVLNYQDNCWSIFRLPVHCLGYYSAEEDLTWDDVEDAWDDIEWSWDDKVMQAGYPITLGGTTDGKIYQLDYGGTDDGDPIEFEVVTRRWNPYINQGMKARLGYVDFLVTRDDAIELTVEFYLDHDSQPYATETLTFDGTSGREKVWKRVYAGGIGESHIIRLYHEASNQTAEIHAIMPWFKPAGRLI